MVCTVVFKLRIFLGNDAEEEGESGEEEVGGGHSDKRLIVRVILVRSQR
jgi:hypothetical protein